MARTLENCKVIRYHYRPAYTNGMCEGVFINGDLLEKCIKCYLHDINNARKICQVCGKEFFTHHSFAKVCSKSCRMQRQKELSKIRNNTEPKKTLDELLEEIRRYNETHGTHLTYGKYQEMKFLEALKNEKNRK